MASWKRTRSASGCVKTGSVIYVIGLSRMCWTWERCCGVRMVIFDLRELGCVILGEGLAITTMASLLRGFRDDRTACFIIFSSERIGWQFVTAISTSIMEKSVWVAVKQIAASKMVGKSLFSRPFTYIDAVNWRYTTVK